MTTKANLKSKTSVLEQIYVSYFETIFSKTPKSVSLKEFFEQVEDPGPSLWNRWESFLKLKETDLKRAKECLPLITVSSLSREKKECKFTNVIHADLDKLENEKLQDLQDKLKRDERVLAFFVSPSGRGLKVFFVLDKTPSTETEFTQYFDTLSDIFKNEYSVKIDNATRNFNQACFYSHDKDIYINPNPVYLKTNKNASNKNDVHGRVNDVNDIHENNRASNKNDVHENKEILELLYKFPKKLPDDGNVNLYLSIIYAVKNVFSELDAYELAKCLLAKSSMLKEIKSILKGNSTNTREQDLAILKKQLRNVGLLRENVTRQSGQNAEIQSETLKNEYKEAIEKFLKRTHGAISKECALEIFNQFQFYKEIVSDALVNENYNEITENIKAELNFILKKHKVSSKLWDSAYNIFLDSLPKKNIVHEKIKNISISPVEANNIMKQFFECLELDDSQNKEIAFEIFKTWFCSSVGGWFYPETHDWQSSYMLVLYGSQGIGKTSFFVNLFSKARLGKFLLNKKGGFISERGNKTLSNNLAVLIDELGTSKKHDFNEMKDIITQSVFHYRAMRKDNEVKLQRLASFCATTNKKELLNDETGNRRYAVLNVKKIDYDKLNTLSDKYNIFEIAKVLYDNNNYDKQAFRKINDFSKDFESRDEVENLLLEICYKSENEYYTTKEIKERIEKDFPEHYKHIERMELNHFGRYVRKLFERKKVGGIYKYCVGFSERVII